MEKVKINSLQIENVKRVKAVVLEPAQAGLTVVGGKNEQGKKSDFELFQPALAAYSAGVILLKELCGRYLL